MVRTTIGYGATLVLVGLVAYGIAGGASVTALIPAFLGGAVLILGFLGRAFPGFARVAVIAALVIAVVAAFGSFRGVEGVIAMLRGEAVARPIAAVAQSLTLLFSLLYLVSIGRLWRRGARAA